ncbi:DUF2029 domain-containing protein [Sphingomonas donggukensis]|uniref:DUF2029 domain-containing protein n=1 Tax=Sphingomonas donggukensis TaxID=2949093 RepID=A0ABY4TRE9_9SPHN|nr:DUF2029 domain-containing protein [Sphingomonas donggukensis]URW74966.1 DUF2029 domain-containing protein [Sphingomonas donggukensis]
MRLPRPPVALALLIVILVALAWLRGLDHDESQYVAAARLTAGGLLPYRDYAYLQTPLQPLAFAPLAWVSGDWAWPALRVANALLAALAVAATWRAIRVAGVEARTATLCAALFATCDILLFSGGTARNDALPAALLACAMVPMLRADRGAGSRGQAMLAGLLLAAAAAAKISYALPAAAYGIYALTAPRHRPAWVLVGALPPIALVAWLAALSPAGFVFGTLAFPAQAPAEFYAATGRAWKLSLAAKAVDVAKFLALGPALLALAMVALRRQRRPTLLGWLAMAGLISALLPAPTWRQYLLPALPPLFVLLALRWQALAPGRAWQAALAGFAAIGLIPSIVAAASGSGMARAHEETARLAGSGRSGVVATLSPQFLPAAMTPDARFATGPFYFRSTGLVTDEAPLHLVSRPRLAEAFAAQPPAAILVGGEGRWTSGDGALDAALEEWAVSRGWRRIGDGRFRLYAPPQATAATPALPSISPR